MAAKAVHASQTKEAVKMVQVHESTHARLSALKVPGLTMEDVINLALDHLSPDEIAAHYTAWQKDAMARLSKVSTPLRRTGAKA